MFLSYHIQNLNFELGVVQQLRGQEEGEEGQPKVHNCPPRIAPAVRFKSYSHRKWKSTFCPLEVGGGQNWLDFGPRSC